MAFKNLSFGEIIGKFFGFLFVAYVILGYLAGLAECTFYAFTGKEITVDNIEKKVKEIKTEYRVKKAQKPNVNPYIDALRGNLYIEKTGKWGRTKLKDPDKVIALIKQLGYSQVSFLSISVFVNHALKYEKDEYLFRVRDKVGSLNELLRYGKGDCDDYAALTIMLAFALKKRRMKFLVVSGGYESHAVAYFGGYVYDYGREIKFDYYINHLPYFKYISHRFETLYFH